MTNDSKTTAPPVSFNEDAVDRAARAIWDEYPAPLPSWDKIPEVSLSAPSRGDFRRMARVAITAYHGWKA